ncbi:hypothetical protein MYU51_019771 [Penicillium brevicompactum]|uniref:uncharacterized protein n=1 Tax=Penicillium brevicompactum TaxID=5074 RepID=UPI00253FDE66|nr:uncharacterized protein N7506_000412 [Penicillium brevicompactum]KAJ5347159.1 hypothetical protein N7506_000412 [Penicillium brevicompactum]
MCVLIITHLLPLAETIGPDCRTVLAADTNRDTFYILLNHMQMHQSSETLTWHVVSGSLRGFLATKAGSKAAFLQAASCGLLLVNPSLGHEIVEGPLSTTLTAITQKSDPWQDVELATGIPEGNSSQPQLPSHPVDLSIPAAILLHPDPKISRITI